MTREEILSHVDHTLLKPEATWPQIQTICDEAIANHTASVCINTCYVKQAVEYMAGRGGHGHQHRPPEEQGVRCCP